MIEIITPEAMIANRSSLRRDARIIDIAPHGASALIIDRSAII
ncbi:hypothetical protein [Glaciihabitans sp. dw_435]|nr:hypothetical protein [Glaciihabitans sp. dw_435]